MIQERKTVKTYNGMFLAYQASCAKISKRYSEQMGRLTQQSVRTLCTLFQSYLIQKKMVNNSCQSTQVKSTMESSTKPLRHEAELIHQQQFINIVNTIPQSAPPKKKDKENVNNQNHVLSKKMNKLSLNNDFLLMQDEDEENNTSPQNVFHEEKLKHKNLSQMIMQSQRKAQQKLQLNKQQPLEDQESEYELTDYSSNQSSNQGEYEAHYAQQLASSKPLFGGLFSKTISSGSLSSNSSTNLLDFKFSSKELLKSPKKLPKNKRLYIGTKKIPKWAEDLGQIQKKVSMQKVNSTQIFGKCIVEHLDTNIIFHNHNENINRTSSAKWNNSIFLS